MYLQLKFLEMRSLGNMCRVVSRTYSSTRFVINHVGLFPRKAGTQLDYLNSDDRKQPSGLQKVAGKDRFNESSHGSIMSGLE